MAKNTNTTAPAAPVVTSKFKIPVRFDAEKATTGVWHTVTDEFGNNYGSFLVSLVDPYSAHTKLRVQRRGRTINENVAPEEEARELAGWVVDMAINDWRDVPFNEDQEEPFSPEVCAEYLTECQFAASALNTFMTTIANFAPQTVETTVKN